VITLEENKQKVKNFLDLDGNGIADSSYKETIPTLVKTNKDYNQYELDTIQEIESFIRALQGYELDPTTSVWVKAYKPLVNNYGVRKIKMHMESIINKHSQTTDLKEEEIHRILNYHIKELIRWFKLNFKLLDVNMSDLSSIISEFDNKSFIILSKSINAGQRNAVTARTKLTGNVTPTGFPT